METVFILVKPAVPGNIGAAARAVKTMGFSKLRLVKPCDHLNMEARMFAHGSNDILENAEVFENLEEALNDIGLSIATSAKQKSARVDYLPVSEILETIRRKGRSISTLGVVFGSEESGLANEEIRLCDMVSSIPMAEAYPSLNLSQAVMIYAYSLSGISPEKMPDPAFPERGNEFRTMMEKTRVFLEKTDINKNPALYNRILERVARLDGSDIHLLLSVLGKLE